MDLRIELKLILNKCFKIVDLVDVPQHVSVRGFVNTVMNFQLGRTVEITLPDKMTAGLSKQSLPPDVNDKDGKVKTRVQKLAAFYLISLTR